MNIDITNRLDDSKRLIGITFIVICVMWYFLYIGIFSSKIDTNFAYQKLAALGVFGIVGVFYLIHTFLG